MQNENGSIRTYRIQDTENGIRATTGNIGAALFSLEIPVSDGTWRDVVLGFEDPEDYRINEPHFGASMVPCVNRIGGAAFTLNGQTYTLDKNDGENSLHGTYGLYDALWEATEVSKNSVTFSAVWEGGKGKLPGPLHADVTYTVQERVLFIDYHGYAQQDTIFNPTNHSYFNLKGQGNGDVLDHLLTVYAERMTPVGPAGVPDGTICSVDDTPFDFQLSETIGARIHEDDPELKRAGGYDLNYILDREELFREETYEAHGQAMYLAARASDPAGEVTMDVYTDLPGMQLYTANFLTGEEKGKGGARYRPQSAFCLETNYFPNAINVPAFPQPVIHAGEHRYSRTVYRF